MSVNDAPAGGTGGLSGEPVPTPDLPEKIRVHALAKLVGRTSKDVLGALAGLGYEVRSVQSNVTRVIAEQVVAELAEPADASAAAAAAPEAAAAAPEATAPAPEATATEVPAPAGPAPAAGGAPAADTSQAAPAPAERPAGLDPFAPAPAAPDPAPSPAPAEQAAPTPVFAVPMFQAPSATTPAPARPAAEPAADEPADTGKKGRRSRKKKRDDEGETAGEAPAPEAAADDTDDDTDTRDAADSGESADDDEGGARRRRRRGRRGRGRGKGGDEQGENGYDESDDESEDSTAGTDSTATEDSDDEAGSDSGATASEDQGSAGSRRRRRRRRRGGSEAEDRSEDDPPNTVTKVREARTDAADDGVQAVRGSTRLEAKRQRRRDGRDAGRRRPPILSEAEFLARRESVDRQMVIRQLADRTEIGVLEDGVLVEHFMTGGGSGSASMVGNIYLGRVQNVLPSMEAAFVDIGRGRNAVLYAGEVNWDAAGLNGKARKIEQALSSGDQVLVQVTKDPVGHKGARLTTQISLAGRFLVYVPSGGAAGISRKLPDTERKRLKEMLKEIVPSEAGVIIRTASEGVSHEALERDVRRLQAQWEVVKERSEKTGPGAPKAPTLLYEEPDMLVKVVRDQFNEDFSKLVVSGADAWDTVSGYVEHVAPELTDRMHRHTGPSDVFTEHRIDEQLLKALDRKVWLPSGGTLVIDRTEAMTVVDVNTGKFTGSGGNLEETVTRNNLEAAEEIVRQLRLRDIGGIIVVDFIDMVLEANRDLVLRRLTECLARDRTRHQVAEVTSLGLVQLTRKRVGGGLLENFSTPCEHCRGRGVIVSTDLPVEHSHGDGRVSGSDGGNGDGGGRRRRRRGGGGGDSGGGANGSTGSDRSSERNGQADRSVDTSSAVAGVAAVAAGRSLRGDDGASAGSSVPSTGDSTVVDAAPAPATDTEAGPTAGPAPEGGAAAPSREGGATAPSPERGATAPSGERGATPAPVAESGTTAPPTPDSRATPAPAPAGDRAAGDRDTPTAPTPGAPATAGDRDGTTTAATPAPVPAAPDTPAAGDAPAPRRRRVSRSAGAPRTAAEPVVITTPAPAGEAATAPAAPSVPAASSVPEADPAAPAPAVPEQPEPSPAVARPRRRRRAASRPAGPPQDGG
ncbi:translation initiation factor IF-2 N-terminal domain-containing protein [Pseudonocardia sp. C8]|uniref:translation initiation factor IF-2 N-terminal domain-containing protein n=1 Tax=Pseudonocardia sp. C8 TaxID=2762759 RepID=UPI001642C1FE|nr:translation initiation factor IF-2 N-terminal domain-containing protein [Pseudonocardia sp. C8]MBC3193270.1 translation initiation factor IF-2 N-terminal domain-containing protein [Pseudonocardia sp. C8]